MFSAEVKKGSAALLVLALVEERPRHGYEISKLIESRSDGALTLPRRLALSDALSPGEARLGRGPMGREGRPAPAALLQADARGT